MNRILILLMLASLSLHAQQRDLFIGTYTSGSSKGIYVYRFNENTGELKMVSVAENVENPSFLALSADRKYLFSVNENGGEKPGEISSFSYQASSGTLTPINKEKSSGDHPCYIATDSRGRFVIAGNYTGGNLTVNPLHDGHIGPAVQVLQHEGSSVNTARQEKAHVHSTILSPDQKFLLVPDLGMDEVWIYPFDASADKPLNEEKAVRVKTDPGAGPRHLCFSPNGKYVYLMQELSGMVAVYKFSNGQMQRIQQISSHPSNYLGEIGSADIHLSPDGRYLYASNRGNSNSIAIFKVDPVNGKIKWKDLVSTRGVMPRNFAIDPSGNFLLVANQQSNNVVVFRRNPGNGSLKFSGTEISIGNPVCLVFGDQASN